MTDMGQQNGSEREKQLQVEIVRLNKIIEALMNRAERSANIQGSDFSLFQTAITLENLVRSRTAELERALAKNKEITLALQESETRIRLIVENAPISIHEIDLSGRVIFMNSAGLAMRGVRSEEEVRGGRYVEIIAAEDLHRVEELFSAACNGSICSFEFKTASGRGGKVFKSMLVPIRENGAVVRLLGLTEDITEQKEAEEQIRMLAFHDPLTMLPNRRLLTDRLRHAQAVSRRTGRFNALMFLDLDNFKQLNDSHGHEFGDRFLVEVARRLSSCVRAMDTVARLGGDEFVVVVSELSSQKEQAAQEAKRVAEKMLSVIARPYRETKQSESAEMIRLEHHCTLSIGVVLFVDLELSQDELLRLADHAMYQAKMLGKNAICFS